MIFCIPELTSDGTGRLRAGTDLGCSGFELLCAFAAEYPALNIRIMANISFPGAAVGLLNKGFLRW